MQMHQVYIFNFLDFCGCCCCIDSVDTPLPSLCFTALNDVCGGLSAFKLNLLPFLPLPPSMLPPRIVVATMPSAGEAVTACETLSSSNKLPLILPFILTSTVYTLQSLYHRRCNRRYFFLVSVSLSYFTRGLAPGEMARPSTFSAKEII